MDLKKYDWSAVLSGVGKIATVFNPAIGGGLLVASEVVDKMNGDTTLADNEVLKNDVIGLTRSSEILADYIQKVELNQAPTLENVKLVHESLKALDVLFDKNYAIMK
ncbi:MAG: hypothetical protein JW802_05515 [Campylobacterales bacterium]|nr:hypothetical protein [Campylobacterales bacterium]MBN2832573.1 hypothetical protein [Campylobacterales bacterium]